MELYLLFSMDRGSLYEASVFEDLGSAPLSEELADGDQCFLHYGNAVSIERKHY